MDRRAALVALALFAAALAMIVIPMSVRQSFGGDLRVEGDEYEETRDCGSVAVERDVLGGCRDKLDTRQTLAIGTAGAGALVLIGSALLKRST